MILQKLRTSRLMRLSLRFILPLAVAIGLFAYAVVPMVNALTLQWFVKDLEIRSQSLVSAMQEPLSEYVPQGARDRILQLFDRAIRDERLYAVGFCDPAGKLVYATLTYPKALGCQPLTRKGRRPQAVVRMAEGSLHISESPVEGEAGRLGRLILVQDMGFVERRSAESRKYVISLFALLALVIFLITVVVAHLSWRGWINAVKGVLRGERPGAAVEVGQSDIQPLVGDLHAMLRELNLERRILGDSPQLWTPDRLRALLHDELAGDEVLVV